MFLYELALQLGVRSTDLVDRARAHGVELGPSAHLTPEQVSWLVAMMAAPPTSPDPDAAAAGAVTSEPTSPAGAASTAPPPPPPPPPTAVAPGPPRAAPLIGSWAEGGPPGFGGASTSRAPQDDVSSPPRSKAAVALFVTVPVVVVVAAVLAYVLFAGGDDDDTTDARSSNGAAETLEVLEEAGQDAEAGNEKGAGSTGVDGVTDLAAYCAAWERLNTEVERMAPADPSDFGAVRRAILDIAPASAAFVADAEPVTTGALREEIVAMKDYLGASVRFMEQMPATSAEITEDHAQEMARFEAEHPQPSRRAVEAAGERC